MSTLTALSANPGGFLGWSVSVSKFIPLTASAISASVAAKLTVAWLTVAFVARACPRLRLLRRGLLADCLTRGLLLGPLGVSTLRAGVSVEFGTLRAGAVSATLRGVAVSVLVFGWEVVDFLVSPSVVVTSGANRTFFGIETGSALGGSLGSGSAVFARFCEYLC